MIFISDEKEQTVEELKEQLDLKDQKIKNQAEELSYLTNNIVPDLKKENKKLKQLKIELTDALEESSKKYFDQLEINADLSDSVTRKGADLQLAKVRLKEIEDELLEIEEKGLNQVEQESQEKTEEPTISSEDLDKKDNEIKNLKNELNKKDKELKEKTKEITHLNDDIIPNLKSDLSNVNKELKDLKNSVDDKKDNEKVKIIQLENKVKDLEEDVLKRTQNNDRLQNELSNKDKTINKLEEKNKELNMAIKEKSEKGFLSRFRN